MNSIATRSTPYQRMKASYEADRKTEINNVSQNILNLDHQSNSVKKRPSDKVLDAAAAEAALEKKTRTPDTSARPPLPYKALSERRGFAKRASAQHTIETDT